jgi:hypothetical protein
VAVYLAYRFWLRRTWVMEIPFFPDHFNDVVCLPIFLPPLLWVQREVGLRRGDGWPRGWEILFHLAVWSVCFEGIAPRLTAVYRTTADWGDVAAYAVGGLGAGLVWGSWRGRKMTNDEGRMTNQIPMTNTE